MRFPFIIIGYFRKELVRSFATNKPISVYVGNLGTSLAMDLDRTRSCASKLLIRQTRHIVACLAWVACPERPLMPSMPTQASSWGCNVQRAGVANRHQTIQRKGRCECNRKIEAFGRSASARFLFMCSVVDDHLQSSPGLTRNILCAPA